MSPQRKINLQEKPYDKTTTIKTDNPLVQDCLAYYQGANYIIAQHVK
ncbi:MAG: hypothetical protein J7M09_03465 [Deltaproteobacteria bacterium]|nr:hypothetical protein [Candidatus Tharpella sp.]